jgi:hypothetical protein
VTVLRPGSEVLVGQHKIVARISAVGISVNDYIRYQIVYDDDTGRNELWVEEFEVSAAHPDDLPIQIGFRK